MWAIEDYPGPKVSYRRGWGWYHFTTGYTSIVHKTSVACSSKCAFVTKSQFLVSE